MAISTSLPKRAPHSLRLLLLMTSSVSLDKKNACSFAFNHKDRDPKLSYSGIISTLCGMMIVDSALSRDSLVPANNSHHLQCHRRELRYMNKGGTFSLHYFPHMWQRVKNLRRIVLSRDKGSLKNGDTYVLGDIIKKRKETIAAGQCYKRPKGTN